MASPTLTTLPGHDDMPELYASGKTMYVKLASYMKLFNDQGIFIQSEIHDMKNIYEDKEIIQLDFENTVASVKKNWSDALKQSEKKVLAAAMVITVLMLVIFALAAALAIALIILL